MKIIKIGYGYTKNEGNYENSKIYLEAELEDWENALQSLDILRSQVAKEMNLPIEFRGIRRQITRQMESLAEYQVKINTANYKLEKAQRAWDNFSEFLTAHGVNPETLTIEDFQGMRELHTDKVGQENTITYSKDDEYVSDDSGELGFSERGQSDDHDQPYADDEENPEYDPLPF